MPGGNNQCCCGEVASCCVTTWVTEQCGDLNIPVARRNLICASESHCAELGGEYFPNFPCGSLPCSAVGTTDCVPCVSEKLCGTIVGEHDCQLDYECAVIMDYDVCGSQTLCEYKPTCCEYGACCTPVSCVMSTRAQCFGTFYPNVTCDNVDCGTQCCCDTDSNGTLETVVTFPGTSPCQSSGYPCVPIDSGVECPPARYSFNTCGCSTCAGLTPDCDNVGSTCPSCYFCCTGTPVGANCWDPVACTVDPGCTCSGDLFLLHKWMCEHGYCFDNTVDISSIYTNPCIKGIGSCSGMLLAGGAPAQQFLKDAAYTIYKLNQSTVTNGSIGIANTISAANADYIRQVSNTFDLGPVELFGYGIVELKRATE